MSDDRRIAGNPRAPLGRVLGLGLLLALAMMETGVVPCVGAGGVPETPYRRLERRLKSAGVDAGLSERISKAVQRGVARLVAMQREDGSWSPPGSISAVGREGARGVTALCALAIQHAETPAFGANVKKALGFVLASDSDGGRGVGLTYTDGLLAMLLFGQRTNTIALGQVVARLTASQDLVTSWWGYASDPTLPNMSTSQFAALGLWAAGLAGRPATQGVWLSHIDGLLSFQTSSGSWPYFPKRKDHGYEAGTFMGYANLVVAKASLKRKLDPASALGKRVRRAIRVGLKAVARDGVRVLGEPTKVHRGTDAWLNGRERHPYFRLYALEKACTFAEVKRLGKRPWYADGAKFLLRVQRSDGAWGTIPGDWPDAKVSSKASGDCISTAFALLFLLRSSEVYRRSTTPRRLRVPRDAVTGSSK